MRLQNRFGLFTDDKSSLKSPAASPRDSLKDFTHECSITFLPPDHRPGFSVPVKFLACSDTDQSVKPGLQAEIEPARGDRVATGAASWEPAQVNVRDNVPEAEGSMFISNLH